MISCGMRLGAWNDLQNKHIQPVKNEEQNIVAAKITIYAGSDEQYTSFISKEAYQAIEEWMDFRRENPLNLHHVPVKTKCKVDG